MSLSDKGRLGWAAFVICGVCVAIAWHLVARLIRVLLFDRQAECQDEHQAKGGHDARLQRVIDWALQKDQNLASAPAHLPGPIEAPKGNWWSGCAIACDFAPTCCE